MKDISVNQSSSLFCSSDDTQLRQLEGEGTPGYTERYWFYLDAERKPVGQRFYTEAVLIYFFLIIKKKCHSRMYIHRTSIPFVICLSTDKTDFNSVSGATAQDAGPA